MRTKALIFSAALAVACGGAAQAQLTDLQGQPIDGPRGIETLEQDRAPVGSAPTPNQSYLVNQSAAVVAITATVAQGDEVRFVFRV